MLLLSYVKKKMPLAFELESGEQKQFIPKKHFGVSKNNFVNSGDKWYQSNKCKIGLAVTAFVFASVGLGFGIDAWVKAKDNEDHDHDSSSVSDLMVGDGSSDLCVTENCNGGCIVSSQCIIVEGYLGKNVCEEKKGKWCPYTKKNTPPNPIYKTPIITIWARQQPGNLDPSLGLDSVNQVNVFNGDGTGCPPLNIYRINDPLYLGGSAYNSILQADTPIPKYMTIGGDPSQWQSVTPCNFGDVYINTYEKSNLFFSHRKSSHKNFPKQGKTGRHISVIGLIG